MKIWSTIDAHMMNPPIVNSRVSYAFFPSDAGMTYQAGGRNVRVGGCRRAQFFRYHNYPSDDRGIDFASAWKMQIGHYTEDLLAPIFMQAGMFIGREINVSIVRTHPDFGQYRISGRIDFLLKDPLTGKPEGMELKTKGAFGTEGVIRDTEKKPLSPDIDNILQVLPYIDWLGMPNQGVVNPRFNILYMSREGERMEHAVYLDPSDRHVIVENTTGRKDFTDIAPEKVYADWDILAKHLADGTVPPQDYELVWSRETTLWKYQNGDLNKTDTKTVETKIKNGDPGQLLAKGDWRCEYCAFKRGCWQGYPGFVPRTPDQTGQLIAGSGAQESSRAAVALTAGPS